MSALSPSQNAVLALSSLKISGNVKRVEGRKFAHKKEENVFHFKVKKWVIVDETASFYSKPAPINYQSVMKRRHSIDFLLNTSLSTVQKKRRDSLPECL